MKRALAGVWLVLFAATAAGAYEFADCSGAACHWDRYPVSYYVRTPLGIDLDEETVLAEIQASFQRWDYEHQTFCAPLAFHYAGTIDLANPIGRNYKNVVSFETENWLYGSEALAITTCSYAEGTSEFVDCDISINAVDYDWALADNGTRAGLRATLTHEIGHFWGLAHSSVYLATMYPYYNENKSAAEDLNRDDILAAAVAFCEDELPADDWQEENDSYTLARVLADRTELNDLRLFDDDWWRLTLAAGKRLKLKVQDQDATRYKSLELYDETGAMVDQQRCDGECAQALGEAGEERTVWLRVTGDYDNHHVQAETYSVTLSQVDPGAEGSLYDDDGNEPAADDDDDDRGCGCTVAPTAPDGGPWPAALIGLTAVGYRWLQRRQRRAKEAA